jgi:hypothetical protein
MRVLDLCMFKCLLLLFILVRLPLPVTLKRFLTEDLVFSDMQRAGCDCSATPTPTDETLLPTSDSDETPQLEAATLLTNMEVLPWPAYAMNRRRALVASMAIALRRTHEGRAAKLNVN